MITGHGLKFKTKAEKRKAEEDEEKAGGGERTEASETERRRSDPSTELPEPPKAPLVL